MTFNGYDRPDTVAETQLEILAGGPVFGLLSQLPTEPFDPADDTTTPKKRAMESIARSIERYMHQGVPYFVTSNSVWRKIGVLPSGGRLDAVGFDRTEEWYGTEVNYRPDQTIYVPSRVDLLWDSQMELSAVTPQAGVYPVWGYSGNSIAYAMPPETGSLTVDHSTPNVAYVAGSTPTPGSGEIFKMNFIVETAGNETPTVEADENADPPLIDSLGKPLSAIYVEKGQSGGNAAIIYDVSGDPTDVGATVTISVSAINLPRPLAQFNLRVDYPAGLVPESSKPQGNVPRINRGIEVRGNYVNVSGFAIDRQLTSGDVLFTLRLRTITPGTPVFGSPDWPNEITFGASTTRPEKNALTDANGRAIPTVFYRDLVLATPTAYNKLRAQVIDGDPLTAGEEFTVEISVYSAITSISSFFVELGLSGQYELAPDGLIPGAGVDFSACVPTCDRANHYDNLAAWMFSTASAGNVKFQANGERGAEVYLEVVDSEGNTVSAASSPEAGEPAEIKSVSLAPGDYTVVASTNVDPATRKAKDSLFVTAIGFRDTPAGRKRFAEDVARIQFNGWEEIEGQGAVRFTGQQDRDPFFPYIGNFYLRMDLMPRLNKLITWAHPVNTASGVPTYPPPYEPPLDYLNGKEVLPPYPFDSRYIAIEVWKWLRESFPAIARLPYLSSVEPPLGPRTSRGQFHFDYDGSGGRIWIVNDDSGSRDFTYVDGYSTLDDIGPTAGSGTLLSPRFLDAGGANITFDDISVGDRVRVYELAFSSSLSTQLRVVQVEQIGNNGLIDPGLIRDADARSLAWRQTFGRVTEKGNLSLSVVMDGLRMWDYRFPTTDQAFVIPSIANGYTIESPIDRSDPTKNIQPLIRNEIGVDVSFTADNFAVGDNVLIYELSGSQISYSSERVVLVRKLSGVPKTDPELVLDAARRSLEGRQYYGPITEIDYGGKSLTVETPEVRYTTVLDEYDTDIADSPEISPSSIKVGDRVRVRHDGNELVEIKYLSSTEDDYDTTGGTTDQQMIGKIQLRNDVLLPPTRRIDIFDVTVANPSSKDTELIAYRIFDPSQGGLRAKVTGIPATLPANTNRAATIRVEMEWLFGGYTPEMPPDQMPYLVLYLQNGAEERIDLVPSYDGGKFGDEVPPLPNWP